MNRDAKLALPAIVALFYFFYFAVIAVHIIFIPKVLSMVGYSPSQIGIIFASAPLIRFIVPFLFLRGLKLNRTIFIYALILLLLSAIGFYVALKSFYALIVVNIALGIGLSLILPVVEVLALEKIGKERYGKIRLFGSIGFVAVSLLLVQFELSSISAIALLALMSAFTLLFGYRLSHYVLDSYSNRSDNVGGFASSLVRHWSLWLGLLLMQVSFGAYYNFFTIYETDRGVSLDMTINLWSFGVFIEIIMLYFQGPLLKRNLLFLLIFATFMTAIRWLIVDLFASDIVILFISQSIHAISFALFHSAAIAYLYTLYAQKQLAQQFFLGVCYGLGGFLGSILSGYIYEYMSDALFGVSALMALLSTLLLIYSSKVIKDD